jgi:ribosome-associated protein
MHITSRPWPERPAVKESNVENQETIRLDQFLKWIGLVRSGGEAKYLIQDGQVQVNGEIETRRSRKLRSGDRVTLGDQTATVSIDE